MLQVLLGKRLAEDEFSEASSDLDLGCQSCSTSRAGQRRLHTLEDDGRDSRRDRGHVSQNLSHEVHNLKWRTANLRNHRNVSWSRLPHTADDSPSPETEIGRAHV